MGNPKILEITVVSAKDLKKRCNPLRGTRWYVEVSITGDPRACQPLRTGVGVDSTGNASPTWNFPMVFSVERSTSRTVIFRIRYERTLGVNKDVGEVHVSLLELDNEDGNLHRVTYQVRRPKSEAFRGELIFLYKWDETIVSTPATDYPAQAWSGSNYPPPPTGYPNQTPPEAYGFPPPQPGYGYPPVQQPQQPPTGYPHQTLPVAYAYPPPLPIQQPQWNNSGFIENVAAEVAVRIFTDAILAGING